MAGRFYCRTPRVASPKAGQLAGPPAGIPASAGLRVARGLRVAAASFGASSGVDVARVHWRALESVRPRWTRGACTLYIRR